MLGQPQVERRMILPDVRRGRGARERADPVVLHDPGEGRLRRGGTVPVRDAAQAGIAEQLALSQR
jgi:hypothetical protein